jgi:hypothetical protein
VIDRSTGRRTSTTAATTPAEADRRRRPGERTCKSKLIPAALIEEGSRDELRGCLPTDDLNEAYRAELLEAAREAQQPEDMTEETIRRLDRQLDRARRLFELGEYDEKVFLRRRAEIPEQQDRLRDQAKNAEKRTSLEWCRVQVFDLVTAWDDADGGQRTALIAGIFDRAEASSLDRGVVRAVAIPCPSPRATRPGVDEGYSEALEMTQVAGGERCSPGGGDAGDLDVPDLDTAAGTLPARGKAPSSEGGCLVERLHPALQVLSEDLLERLLQLSPSFPYREELQPGANLEDSDRSRPNGLRRLAVEPRHHCRIGCSKHQRRDYIRVEQDHLYESSWTDGMSAKLDDFIVEANARKAGCDA